MSNRDWEVNAHGPIYQTRDGNISIRLQNNDDVDLRVDGYEYTVRVNLANESGVSKGTIKSYRSIGGTAESDIRVGKNVTFIFNNVFSVKRP